MTFQDIQNFFVENAYVLELLSAILLFCHFIPRRKLWLLRFSLLIVLFFTLSIFWNLWKRDYVGYDWALVTYNITKYVVAFLIGFLGIIMCLETRFLGAFFTMICAMASQHLSFRIYASILTAANLGYDSVPSFFIIFAVSALVYVSEYFILVRKVQHHSDICFENKLNIVLGGTLIFFTIILQFILEPLLLSLEDTPSLYNALFIGISAYDIICCIFTLLVEYGLFQNKVLVSENAILEHLVHKQEEQYRATKANVEMINIKCHDMKHQIAKLVKSGDSAAVSELEDVIKIYDSALQTGNEILDVFLMEKKLLCEKNDIKLDCIVNGGCLSFMLPSDIFSLFGNALDNAIEALLKIEDVEKRIIGLNVKTQLGMVIIHVENYYEGELEFYEGLPRTTKEDENYHGYGVRSIKMVTEKYGGTVSVLVQEGIFNLNIAIPLENA